MRLDQILSSAQQLATKIKQRTLRCVQNFVNTNFITIKKKKEKPPAQTLPKRAKKDSIAADCGELKATFGPRLRCAAVQQVKQ